MKRTIHAGLTLLAASLFAATATANDLRLIDTATQGDIRAMSRDLTAALSYKSLAPAEAFGVLGFGVGAYVTYADIDDSDAWSRATGGRDPSSLTVTGVTARKGLPLGVDVSAFVAKLPGNDGTLLGGAAQYAFLPGGTVMPALALQVGYARLNSVDDFDFDAWNVNLSVSKGFLMFTPYGGVGYASGKLDPDSALLGGERADRGRVFGGVRVSLGLIDITPEIEQSGSNFVASLRLGVTL